MLDSKIVGGLVVDGTGDKPYRADIGIKDGLIVEVRRTAYGTGIEAEAAETIDATGRIVTPGFVDIHTHYDGQVTWDALLEPSSLHGVTTVVCGNCGVGFAPVRPGREQWLIELMEGVEDIPGYGPDRGHRRGAGRPSRSISTRSRRSELADRFRRPGRPRRGARVTRWASAAPATRPPPTTTSPRWRASSRRRSRPVRWASRPPARRPTARWTASRFPALCRRGRAVRASAVRWRPGWSGGLRARPGRHGRRGPRRARRASWSG